MTNNVATLKETKLNAEQLEKVAGGSGDIYCPRCGSTKVRLGGSSSSCGECSAVWKQFGIGTGLSYHNPGKVCCPNCGSRSLEFLLRSTNTVKYSCKKCQHPFGLQDGHYC